LNNTRSVFAAVLVSLWVIVGPAVAQEGPEALGLQLRTRTQLGGDKPSIALQPSFAVNKLHVVLTPEGGGRSIRLSSGAIRAGRTKILSWKQAVGTARWKATFHVQYYGGTKDKFDLTFESTVYPKIASKITKSMVYLDEKRLEVLLNQPAKKVEIQVFGEDGEIMHEGEEEFDDSPPSTPLSVPWEQDAGVRVLKINLRVWSVFGFWVGTEITPFEIEIPHDDVEFETGQWEIRVSERSKIDQTRALLSEKLKRYGGLLRLQLYVAGYTDTVGSRESNQGLSDKRARSIATYFRSKGVRIPIFYQGFGEDAPAVPTPDNTAEQRNRRALYVLSASAPATQSAIPRSLWKRIP
jgi:outer membrane protein OmpA-like peptidoglycan-associated protein